MKVVFKLSILCLFFAVVNGNSFNYGFQQCRVTCGDSSQDFVNLVSNRPVAVGKQGPAGAPGIRGPKGEPGTVDDALMSKLIEVSQKSEKLEEEIEEFKKLFSTPHIRS